MHTDASDRRQAKRYPMEMPMRFDGHEGRTRDMSSRGIYFLAEAPLQEGEHLEMNVVLTHASTLGPMALRMRGRIIRVELMDTVRGVAAAIDAWEVTDPDVDAIVAGA